MSTPLDRLKLINHLTQNNDFDVGDYEREFDEFDSLYDAFAYIQSKRKRLLGLNIFNKCLKAVAIGSLVLSICCAFGNLMFPATISNIETYKPLVPHSVVFALMITALASGIIFIVTDDFRKNISKYLWFNTQFNKKCFDERTNALNDLNQWEPQLSTEDLQLLQNNPSLSKWGKEWVEKSLKKRIQLDEKKQHEELFLKCIAQPVSVSVDTTEPLVSCDTQDEEYLVSSPAITKI